MKHLLSLFTRFHTIPHLEHDQDPLEDLVTPLMVGLMAVLVLVALI